MNRGMARIFHLGGGGGGGGGGVLYERPRKLKWLRNGDFADFWSKLSEILVAANLIRA